MAHAKHQVRVAHEGEAGVSKTRPQQGGPERLNCGQHRDTRDLWHRDRITRGRDNMIVEVRRFPLGQYQERLALGNLI